MMGQYILSVTVCAVATAFICAASPVSSGFNKLVGFIASLVITVVIVSPIANGEISIEKFDFSTKEEPQIPQDHRQLASKSLAYSIADAVNREGINIEIVDVKVILDEREDFLVDKVVIRTEETDADLSASEKYLSQRFNCIIEIREEEHE